MGLNIRKSTERSRSIARASSFSFAACAYCLPFPATICNARGNEETRAVTESTATHQAIRNKSQASSGLDTILRVMPERIRLVLVMLLTINRRLILAQPTRPERIQRDPI